MMVIRAGIHKMVVKIAKREDPDQTASSVWQATHAQNFIIFTVQ